MLRGWWIYWMIVFFLSACRQDEGGTEAMLTPQEEHGFNIRSGGVVLHCLIPKDVNNPARVNVVQNSRTGHYDVHFGQDFSFQLRQEKKSLEFIREDLAQNDLFDYIFFDAGDEAFFYEAILPDGSSAGHHYIRTFSVNDVHFVAETPENEMYGYFVAQMAAKAINSLSVVE